MALDLLCRYEISSNTAPSATPCATTLATVKMGRTVAAVAASAAAIAAYCAYSYYKKRRVIAAIRAMPKIELHVHLDGAFDADTLFKLSMARVDELPEAIASQIRACGTDINKFKALATCTGKEEQTLKAMIDKFVFFLPIVQGQYTYLEALAYRFVEGQALQNILYTEVRYSPHILTAAATFDGTSTDANDEEARAVVAAVTRGLRRGCAAHPGTEIAQILCFIDCQPQWADSLVAIATELKANDAFDSPSACDALPPCPVVAVDVAAGEAHFVDYFTSPSSDNGKLHRAAMCKCRANGLGLTNHAGESGPASHVALAASETYGSATRIGHGYEAVREAIEAAGYDKRDDTSAMAEAFKGLGVPDGLCFECCPTSSRATSGWVGADWKDHPAATLTRLQENAEVVSIEVGANYLFCDDDPSGDDPSAPVHAAAAAVKSLPRATISSDDPAVFNSSLTDELEIAVFKMGLGTSKLKLLMGNAVNGAFLSVASKERLMKRFEEAWAVWGGLPRAM